MSPDLFHFIAEYYRWLQYVAIFVACILLVSGIDDLFVDACYWLTQLRRKLAAKRRHRPLKASQLGDRPEQHLAIMIPTWHEDDVIASVMENMVKALDYQAYTIFVGTYRNDTATIAEVERLRERYKQIVRVEVPHDGPTCKADCLNWIVRAIFAHETRHATSFAGVVLHGCEDILHPLELQFLNYLLPRKDVIQLPVASLEREWHELVAGVYMDEYAEWQGKDLLVREGLTKMVPLPGTGTCFSRRALMTLAAETDGRPFNTETLTADYDIGLRLADRGMRPILARLPVEYNVKRMTWLGHGKEKKTTANMPLCVQRYFPNNFHASYRQKAQWSLGVSLQGWASYGWHGSLAERYFLLRDRKVLVTVFLAILAYIIATQYALFGVMESSGLLNDNALPRLVSKRWFDLLLVLNVVVFASRIIQRAYFTGHTFGWQHGLLSLPRTIVGHFVRAMAMARAWRLYLSHLIFGTRLVWDRTRFDVPAGRLSERIKLGELLLSWRAVDEEQVKAALEKQNARSIPFGRILVQEGWLAEEVLAEAIAFQSDLELTSVTEAEVLAGKCFLPIEFSVRWRVLALPDDGGQGKVRLATAMPLSEMAEAQIREALGFMPRQFIARDRDITAGLRILTKADVSTQESPLGAHIPLLGDLIVEQGFISRQAFDKAMMKYSPERDGLIGSYLVAKNIINQDMLQCTLDEQRRLAEESENLAESSSLEAGL